MKAIISAIILLIPFTAHAFVGSGAGVSAAVAAAAAQAGESNASDASVGPDDD